MLNDTALPEDPVYRADCPSRVILDQIADKWSVLVLAVLVREPRRFNALKRRLEGVTQRVLTQTLRKLERNGMVERRVLDGSPPGVEYTITSLGRSLQETLSALYAWTVANMDEIQKRQRQYDRRA